MTRKNGMNLHEKWLRESKPGRIRSLILCQIRNNSCSSKTTARCTEIIPKSLRCSVAYIRFIANAFRVSSRPLSYNSFETRNITEISLIQPPPRARECLSTLYRISPMHANDLEISTKKGIPLVSPEYLLSVIYLP